MKLTPMYRTIVVLGIVAIGMGTAVAKRSDARLHRTFSADEVSRVEVAAKEKAVEIRRGESDEIVVTAHITVKRSLRSRNPHQADDLVRRFQKNPPFDQNGDTLMVGYPDDKQFAIHAKISYEISVPAGVDVTTL